MKTSLIRVVHHLPLIGPLARRIRGQSRNSKVVNKIQGNNSIRYQGAKLSAVTFDIAGENNLINIGKGCVLNNVKFYIRGDNHSIVIEANCRFNDSSEIWIEDSDCSLVIGEDSTFESVHLALTEVGSKIHIGRDCMFAHDIDVRTGDSHSIISQQTGERVNRAKDVRIGEHVWVAAHCVILKGVNIADNSVVATGAIVTRSFEKQGIIIGGNPAAELKQGINWSRERI